MGSYICPVAQTRPNILRLLFPQSWTSGGESQSALAQGRFEPPTCQSTAEHANHQTMMTAPSRRINYCTPGPHSSTGGSSAKTAAPCVGHHVGASTFETKNIVNDCLKKLNTGEGRGAHFLNFRPQPFQIKVWDSYVRRKGDILNYHITIQVQDYIHVWAHNQE